MTSPLPLPHDALPPMAKNSFRLALRRSRAAMPGESRAVICHKMSG
jgi:hypothetical protein